MRERMNARQCASPQRMAWEVPERRRPMTDLWILVLTVGLFGLTFGFVRLCERM